MSAFATHTFAKQRMKLAKVGSKFYEPSKTSKTLFFAQSAEISPNLLTLFGNDCTTRVTMTNFSKLVKKLLPTYLLHLDFFVGPGLWVTSFIYKYEASTNYPLYETTQCLHNF